MLEPIFSRSAPSTAFPDDSGFFWLFWSRPPAGKYFQGLPLSETDFQSAAEVSALWLMVSLFCFPVSWMLILGNHLYIFAAAQKIPGIYNPATGEMLLI